MMYSQAVNILATMQPVTVETITTQDIDVALLCAALMIYDHTALVEAADALILDDYRRSHSQWCMIRRAANIVNDMIARRK